MKSRGRAVRDLLVPLLTVPLLACGLPDGSSAQSGQVDRIARGERWETDFSKRSVPLSEIRLGGPPKDGIPAIDDPKFEGVEGGDRWLDPKSPVMVVEVEGEAKAYPLSILIAHEIVNDRIGGEPVTVTYCPLCNTALAFDRRVDGRVLDFGTTGRLRKSDLVMYDRQTETWWQQATGTGIIGEMTGTTLEFVPANVLSWEKAKELHGPDLRVLSQDTGFRRGGYGRNPYAGYDRIGNQPIGQFISDEPDERLPAMERVAGIASADGERAWAAPFSELEKTRVAHTEVDDREIVIFWSPGAASALDAREVSKGRDVGMTAAYSSRVGDRVLTFEWRDGAWRDGETGSEWDLAGRAVAGPLEGERLEKVNHGNHFWFAWTAFHPETEIWRAG